VVTGIVQEFQFGMNWSDYSRFVGDIFGVPLAIEALLAFFLESVFLGVWIFGWNRLPAKIHLASIWMVALGSNLSALWILIANSFMQQPVGYVIRNGRAELTDFPALITNPHVWLQFPHVFAAGMATAGFFVLAVSAYHLLRNKNHPLFLFSFRTGLLFASLGIVGVVAVGHHQAQHMIRTQPMKMAAAEALWQTENPASFSFLSLLDEQHQKDLWSIRIPYGLSLLAHNRPEGEVKGIKNLQEEYSQRFGPRNYIPPVAVSYWTFRIMVGVGFLMLGLSMWGLLILRKSRDELPDLFLKICCGAWILPYLANSTGWIFTEMARQPWIVFGLQFTEDAVSPTVSAAMAGTTLIGFSLLYGILMGVNIYLMKKTATREVPVSEHGEISEVAFLENHSS
jgi:cytochrome bd ubiquinol oxidase subunit I